MGGGRFICSPMNPVHQVIQDRITEKVIGNVSQPTIVPPLVSEKNDPLVREAVKVAGMAPFHYPRTKGIAEPWRVYHLWNEDCHTLGRYLQDELGVQTKEPKLLAAASAVVLLTWLPEHPFATTDKQRTIEEEHIAATGAFGQNLLLLLTSHGFGNYWSSGGILRKPEVLSHIGIDPTERLMGAIFIEYPECRSADAERKLGALRKLRGTQWIKELSL